MYTKQINQLLVNDVPENFVAAVGTSAEAITYLALTGKLITQDALRNFLTGKRIVPGKFEEDADVVIELVPGKFPGIFYDEAWGEIGSQVPSDIPGVTSENLQLARKKIHLATQRIIQDTCELDQETEKKISRDNYLNDISKLGIEKAIQQAVYDYSNRLYGVEFPKDPDDFHSQEYGHDHNSCFFLDNFSSCILENKKNARDFNLAELAMNFMHQDVKFGDHFLSKVEEHFDYIKNLRGVIVYFNKELESLNISDIDDHINEITCNVGIPIDLKEGIDLKYIEGIRFMSKNDKQLYNQLVKKNKPGLFKKIFG
jgi:hypothetical protein